MHRYYDMAYINKMPLNAIERLVKKAKEEENREKFYRWWLVRYPLYSKENYETFEEFYDNYGPKKIILDNRPKDELMKEILSISGRS